MITALRQLLSLIWPSSRLKCIKGGKKDVSNDRFKHHYDPRQFRRDREQQ